MSHSFICVKLRNTQNQTIKLEIHGNFDKKL